MFVTITITIISIAFLASLSLSLSLCLQYPYLFSFVQGLHDLRIGDRNLTVRRAHVRDGEPVDSAADVVPNFTNPDMFTIPDVELHPRMSLIAVFFH